MPTGWGLQAWGTSGYGVPAPGDLLQLLSAEPWTENVVRLTFNSPVYFSLLLDPQDASSRRRYAISPVVGSLDGNGMAPRPVLPAWVAPAGGGGRVLDLTVDRPFASWPARYLVSVNHLMAADGTPLDGSHTSAQFDGCQYDEIDSVNPQPTAGGDFANPQTANSQAASFAASPAQAAILGSYPVSSSGDYAIDRGLESYKKRILRRLTSKVNGFAYLSSSFGLAAIGRIKKILRPNEGSKLAAEAQAQVQSDPETQSCTVSFTMPKTAPGVVYLHVAAIHVSGAAVNETVALVKS